jgi:hypothetical protein
MVRMVNGLRILSNKNKYQANTIQAMAERRWGQAVGEPGAALHISSPAEVVVEHGDEVGLWERGDTRGNSLPRQAEHGHPNGRAGARQYGRRRPHQSGERDGTGAGSPWRAARTSRHRQEGGMDTEGKGGQARR